jgi:hypothetical protein
MKKLLLLVLIVLVLIQTGFCGSRKKTVSNGNIVLKINNSLNSETPKNILKIDPGKLILGGINLSYERILTPGTSVNFRAKYHPLGFVERNIKGFKVSETDYSFELADRPAFYHFGLDAEYRFYIKNKYPGKGFYLAPYAHYLNYTGTFKSNYTSEFGDLPVSIDGSLKTSFGIWGIGLQLGAQWKISDRVSIDWGFVGLGIDRYNFEVAVNSGNLDNLVDKYSNDLQNVLGGVSGFLSRKLAFYALDNGLSSSVPFWMVGWKSFLTVGIAF